MVFFLFFGRLFHFSRLRFLTWKLIEVYNQIAGYTKEDLFHDSVIVHLSRGEACLRRCFSLFDDLE